MTDTRTSLDWDAIRTAHPIAEVIGGIVPLKAKGRELVGCCPFHHEKTPSFYVVPEKQFAHCFGCGWHGDVVDFIAASKGIDTIGAVNLLTGGDTLRMTDEERAARKRVMKEREEAQAKAHAAATLRASQRWENADPADGDNPYLTRKCVESHGCRQEGQNLLLPLYGPDGEIMSVQAIAPDGGKRFHAGALSKYGRMTIGIHMGRTIICEGYATGASIYDAIPDQVCVAFSKANIHNIAREYHDAGAAIVIACDRNAIDEMTGLAAALDCPLVVPDEGDDFNDQAKARGTASVAETFNRALSKYARDRQREADAAKAETGPTNLWAQYPPPPFPRGLLPPIIERFATIRADMMGVDPGGIAMAALAACCAVIRDRISIKVKQHEKWHEEARLWIMLVGDPSYKKSPIMKAAATRVSAIDTEMLRQYNRDFTKWKEDGEHGDMPVPVRLRIEDTTMEAAQEVCVHSPDGVLALQDELSGWFGGIEKYRGGKGGAKDRSFWLRAYNGGQMAVNRVSRKSILIENLSISILGGVQPDAIRKIVSDSTDDGLIQRFIPVVLRPSGVDKDVEMPDVAGEYDALIERLHALEAPQSFLGKQPMQFDDDARQVREELARKHHRIVSSIEGFNKKLAAHIGKWDGMFPRLCIIWHCIENIDRDDLPLFVSGDTAARVAEFMHRYMMKHACAFYFGTIGLADDHETLRDVAGYILAHNLKSVTMRTLSRGSRSMRRLTRDEGGRIFEQLEAFGWLAQQGRRTDAPSWDVNPAVHTMFAEMADEERTRRADMRQVLADMAGDD